MADAILLPRVLHYWYDKQVISILQKANYALLPDSKIYLTEMLIDEKRPDGLCLILICYQKVAENSKDVKSVENIIRKILLIYPSTPKN
ncbi:MAG: methyltransferase [Arsenophonus sp. NEOnobi-MAG3]